MPPRRDPARPEVLRTDIARAIAAHGDIAADGGTHVPGLLIGHLTRPLAARPYLYGPSLCVCVRGSKDVLFGDRRYTYDPDRALVTAIDLPTVIEVTGATPSDPYTALQVRLDLSEARHMMDRLPDRKDDLVDTDAGFGIIPLEPELLDAIARLVSLLERPHDVPVLAPLWHREILYRLLTGPAGAHLRRVVRAGSPTHRVAAAMSWLRVNYAQPCRVETLAERCGMRVTTFYRHFEAITTMTPLQYQKRLRLHEARRLMLTDGIDATGAAFRVGYGSATQFGREYRRMFGVPPGRDIRDTKASEAHASCQAT